MSDQVRIGQLARAIGLHENTIRRLANALESVAELSKGKRTTAPKAHSGEGIFFTSKAVDVFQLSSDGIQWTVDNLLGDFSVEHRFVRTRPTVKLFETGMTFVSRSEARRLLTGLGKFNEIQLDFEKVEAVGQGFVDEIFRVWATDNLDKKIIPINMNDAVSFMVNRGIAGS